MLNTFSRSLIILRPAIETWTQEMNGGPGKNWGARELNSSRTLKIILYIYPFRHRAVTRGWLLCYWS